MYKRQTEAGIVFDETDVMEGTPKTYPGKLTAFLYHRWKHFGGDETKGMIIIQMCIRDRR